MTMRIHGDKIEFPDGTEQFTASTGGGGDAQPPVAFNLSLSSDQDVNSGEEATVKFDTALIDTENAFDNTENSYVVKKEGIYQLNYSSRAYAIPSSMTVHDISLYVNDTIVQRGQNTMSDSNKGFADHMSNTFVCKLNVGDVLKITTIVTGLGDLKVYGPANQTTFSGHMVSSITEGEVKEKEAVVFRGEISADQTIPVDTATKVEINTASIDTNSALTDGTFKPSVAGYYQINAQIGGTGANLHTAPYLKYKDGTLLVGNNIKVGDVGLNYTSTVSDIRYFDGKTDYVELEAYINGAYPTLTPSKTFLSAHLITGQSSGGSGGGDYTPEKMVWEDVKDERPVNIDHENINDVPLYVQVSVGGESVSSFWIDGALMGNFNANDVKGNNTSLFIVPSKSTYKLTAPNSTIFSWREARMPVAVGTGGKTVAFKGGLSTAQNVPSNVYTKINIDDAIIDTDNALTDGKFQPSVAGYYQVNGTIGRNSGTTAQNIVASIYKNESAYCYGSDCSIETEGNNTRSTVSDLIYLNGEDDYIELWGKIKYTAGGQVINGTTSVYLSAVLVSGGSGDSIWTEEDGKAVYDGGIDIKSNIKFTERTGGNEFYVGPVASSGDFGIDNNSTTGKIRFVTNSTEVMAINSDGHVIMPKTPSVTLPDISRPNVHMGGDGKIYKTTESARTYTTEEVDNKLAIKDKLIEKLSARLDALEKRVK